MYLYPCNHEHLFEHHHTVKYLKHFEDVAKIIWENITKQKEHSLPAFFLCNRPKMDHCPNPQNSHENKPEQNPFISHSKLPDLLPLAGNPGAPFGRFPLEKGQRVEIPRVIHQHSRNFLIFQFPIYFEPGVDRYLIYWLAWELGSTYIGNWKMLGFA